ncbi:hypothetical protein LTR22_003592 [Elasticomyces elasticus]|nr:hypothetical protein LTR22_003592 [Elasticomyces elasticus]KAK4930310.1 hypothetical protein LTR49_003051 [Elasticomyces elasticus]KAK5749955.1 hypothetical protein LTS12_019964 [Elasticomyces elasticus]
MPKPYVYRNLDPEHQEIRLLEVLPDKYHKPLKVVIRPTSLHAKYETISYAWGDPTPSARIAVSDGGLFSRKRYLLVPAQTEAALKRVRLPDSSRVVWIDAVCINQANDEERGQQVAIMSDIYRSSNRNLIFVGDEDGLVESAVGDMNLIYDEMRLRTDDFTAVRSVLYYDEGYYRHSEESLGVQLNLEAFVDLIGRPWFSRLWVLQEVSLASENRCYAGKYEFDLLFVLRVAAWLNYHRTSLPTEFAWNTGFRNATMLLDHVDHQHGIFSTKTTRRTLYNLLLDSTLRQTSDPRDRVFGVFGLPGQLPDSCRHAAHLVTPDYRRDITEVQRNATRYAILEENALNVLTLVNHSEASLASDVCSWAVRLGGNKDDEPAILQWELYNAASGRVVDPRLVLPDAGLHDSGILSLSGIVSDVVVETSEAFAPESFHSAETFERALLTIEDLASRRTTISKETMFRVLVAGRSARSEQLTDLEAHEMAASRDSCKVSRLPVSEELRLRISTFAWERCVFATAKGALGLGPAVIAAGDLVTVLDGGVVPYFGTFFHILDATIIITAFILDVLLKGIVDDISSLVIVLRLWKVVKIIGEMSAATQARLELLEEKVIELENENEKLRGEIDILTRMQEQAESTSTQ